MSSNFYDYTGPLPAPVQDTVVSLMAAKSPFFANGLFAIDPASSGGGAYVTRRYSEEDATHDVSIDGSAQAPGYVGAVADRAPVLRRMRYRRIVAQSGAAEASLGSGNTPEDRVLLQSGSFWASEWDQAAIAVINACFGAGGCLASTHVLDKSVSTGTPVALAYSHIIDAQALLGDRGSEAVAIVTHSKTAADLLKESGSKTTFIPVQGVRAYDSGLYVGPLKLLVSDAIPTSGSGTFKTFTSIIVCAGGLWFSQQSPLTEVRAAVPSVPALDLSEHWAAAVGVSGTTYTGLTVPPTNAQIATAGDWTLTVSPMTPASRRSVGMAALVTNASNP
jgi:hypothetical protein